MFPLHGLFVGNKVHSLGVVSAAPLRPVFVFQTFQMSCSYISLSHALCSIPREKLWSGEIHRKVSNFIAKETYAEFPSLKNF